LPKAPRRLARERFVRIERQFTHSSVLARPLHQALLAKNKLIVNRFDLHRRTTQTQHLKRMIFACGLECWIGAQDWSPGKYEVRSFL
jgi:hypothetical protein